MFQSNRYVISLLLVLAFGVFTFQRALYVNNPQLKHGSSMGTTYSFTVAEKLHTSTYKQLKENIEGRLKQVNHQMSTWQPTSEIARFNESQSTNFIAVSTGFATVIHEALKLSQETRGAFDPTLNPLLNLWGFGSESDWNNRTIPSDSEILAVKAETGWHHLRQLNDTLQKEIPTLQLDLGAIAKGYGVDCIAAEISALGLANFYVEIGGEVIVSGHNPEGVPWRIGIQNPSTNPMDGSTFGILHITQGAVATSGDYRNYIEHEGRHYSHILDPHTGRAMLSDLASVSVYTSTCMEADGIATALFVMGDEKGLVWVENQPGVEALFLKRQPDGTILEIFSTGFKEVTGYTKP